MALFEIIKGLITKKRPEHYKINQNELSEAYRDKVTGITGRVYLEKLALTNSMPAGLTRGLLIDLDSFNQVNRTRGRIEGDKLLRVTAQILSGLVNSKGQVFRYHDDQFLLLCTPESKQDEILKQTSQKIKSYYDKRLNGLDQGLTATQIYLDKGRSLKEELARAEESIREMKINKYRKKDIATQNIAILERRDEQTLCLKYLLGQERMQSKSDLKLLFQCMNHENRERVERHAQAIKHSGLEVVILTSYDEVCNLAEWNDNFESMVLYKTKEKDNDLNDLLNRLYIMGSEINYIIPFGNSKDPETAALMSKIRERKYPTVMFSESSDLPQILRTIKHYDLKRLARNKTNPSIP